jgi:hypothetical protein
LISLIQKTRKSDIRVVLKQNSQHFFSADLSCESASHHFALFFFETGSLERFVVLKLPQYFLQRARKLSQNLLDSDSDLMRPPDTPPPPPYLRRSLPPSRCAFITLHSLALRLPLTALVPCCRPPPPSRCVVPPHPRLSRLRRRSEGTVASPHPSPSRWRRGKIQSIAVVLRSNDDASRCPPPPLVAPSNICSRSRQRDNIAAPAIVAAAR